MKRIMYSFLMVTLVTVATTLAWADEEKSVNDDRNTSYSTSGNNTEAGYTGGCEDCRRHAIGCTLKDPRQECQPAKPPVEGQSATPSGVKGRR